MEGADEPVGSCWASWAKTTAHCRDAPARVTEEPGAMRVAVGMLWLLALWGHPQTQGSCPSQCSCSLHILGDGSKARYGIRCGGWVASSPHPPSPGPCSISGWVGRPGCRVPRTWLGETSIFGPLRPRCPRGLVCSALSSSQQGMGSTKSLYTWEWGWGTSVPTPGNPS